MSASQSFIDQLIAPSPEVCDEGPCHNVNAWFCRCNDCLNDFVTACVEAPNPDDALRLAAAIDTLRERRQMTGAVARALARRMRDAHRRRPQRVWRNVPGSYRSPPSPRRTPAARAPAHRPGTSIRQPIVVDDDSQDIITSPVNYTRVITVIRRVAHPDLDPVVYIEEMENTID
jgi:hypothetical protein